MRFTTRTKITALFSLIVMVLLVGLNFLIIENANREWQEKKHLYMWTSMDSVLTAEEAKKQFPDLSITDNKGNTIYKQGVFLNDLDHQSIGSWLFDDPEITRANDKAYFWMKTQTKDGNTLTTVDDVTDIIHTRDQMIFWSIWFSGIGLLLVMVIGHFFSGYILRPIRNMNDAARRFSISEKGGHNPVGIYGNIKDEVVILARSLEELFARVNKEAERLEQFSDDIAHEIKNKLFEIQSSLDIAEHPDHLELGLSRAKAILKELSRVVDALLFFARDDVGPGEEMNLARLLEEAYWNDDARLENHIEAKVVRTIHKDLFVTAIGNIVSNAQKFTDEKGKIELYLRKDGIEIRDTGIGIPEKDLPHIFERLYKADKARTGGTGHGIGLAIAKKILEDLHKMKISVESTAGKGSTFFIKWTI